MARLHKVLSVWVRPGDVIDRKTAIRVLMRCLPKDKPLLQKWIDTVDENTRNFAESRL